jgi:hypothetical protein
MIGCGVRIVSERDFLDSKKDQRERIDLVRSFVRTRGSSGNLNKAQAWVREYKEEREQVQRLAQGVVDF